MTLTDDIRAVAPDLTPGQITQIVALARELEPLEWRKEVGPTWNYWSTARCEYEIHRKDRGPDHGDFWLLYNGTGKPLDGFYLTLKAAKAAAEAHRAERIRWRE